jgi:hypothetical protein
MEECPPGTVPCGRSCVDLSRNRWHCGACDHACEPDEVCQDGECVLECTEPYVDCDGVCVDLTSDPENCGMCGVECAEGEACYRGVCGACPPGLTNCDGVCVDLQTNGDNCGACGHECPPERPVCDHGECVEVCGEGRVLCGNVCADLMTDPLNCGECFRMCLEDWFCVGGECLEDCPEPLVYCDPLCVDLSTNPANCGWCYHACAPGEICAEGDCLEPCDPGETRCGELCVDLGSNNDHCGECDHACEVGWRCIEGECIEPCGIDEIRCGGVCVKYLTDPENCGACGTVCSEGWVCAEGECMLECPEGLEACDRSCVNLETDPRNCGRCGMVCFTGICADGICADWDVGHVVLMGHNYLRSHFTQQQLLVNAVTIPFGPDVPEVHVLAFTGHAPTEDVSPTGRANAAIMAVSSAAGIPVTITELIDETELPEVIGAYDTLLIYEQSLATDDDLQTLGMAWAATLVSFLNVGGVIVVLDGAQGNSGTWQVLDAAGLVAVDGTADASLTRVSIVRPSDMVARGVSPAYMAGEASVSYATGEIDIVAENTGGPVILHPTFAPTGAR